MSQGVLNPDTAGLDWTMKLLFVLTSLSTVLQCHASTPFGVERVAIPARMAFDPKVRGGSADLLTSLLGSAGPAELAKLLPSPDQLLDFVKTQAMDASVRRQTLQKQAETDLLPFLLGILSPTRVVAIAVASYVLVQASQVATVGPKKVWKQSIQPLWKRLQQPQSITQSLHKWWTRNRQKNQLLHAKTWQGLNPKKIVPAWNRALTAVQQRGVGWTVGWIVAPLLWTAATVVGQTAIAAVALSEVYNFVNQQTDALQKTIKTLPGGEFLDGTLQMVRAQVQAVIKSPLTTLQSGLGELDDKVPEEVLPVSLQQGIAVGVLMGLLSGL